MSNQIANLEPGRPARPGQLILERRFSLAKRALGGFDRGELMLDLGCGNGAQTVYFAPFVRRIVGVDIIAIKETEQAAAPSSFNFICSDAGYLPLKANSFNLATSFEVLEHVADDRLAINEVARILAPGGKFFFSVPSKWWIFESHGANVPGFNWLPWNRIPLVSWLPRFLHLRIAKARIYTIKSALALVRDAGLEPVSWGYITAPLDVLPEGMLRRFLRETFFKGETTRLPFLAVNLFVCCKKPIIKIESSDES